MSNNDIALMAHLMRRAGFGATYSELEERASRGYEATVDELLYPDESADLDDDLLLRYDPGWYTSKYRTSQWLYNMVRTRRPLEEKMALFWHGLFATGALKVVVGSMMRAQLDTFREHSLSNFHTMLVELSKDPAMLFWLDNCQSHLNAPNENYGRELLELFSMGVGNYNEDDVYAAAEAFTGWTFRRLVCGPYRISKTEFKYIPEDHDDSEKSFLGERGRFNGEDIIDIIVRQPATALFLAKKLHNFFVSDEPDEAAIRTLAAVYVESGYDMRSVMRALFLSDFFKEARFAKVKSPVEAIVGIKRLAGDFDLAKEGFLDDALPVRVMEAATQPSMNMGQEVLNPPSVEGWHTGQEWVDSGTLMERINYGAARLGDPDKPGVRFIADRLSSGKERLEPTELVDGCLELIGCHEMSEITRESLENYASQIDGHDLSTEAGHKAFGQSVASMLRLIVATPDFQLA